MVETAVGRLILLGKCWGSRLQANKPSTPTLSHLSAVCLLKSKPRSTSEACKDKGSIGTGLGKSDLCCTQKELKFGAYRRMT